MSTPTTSLPQRGRDDGQDAPQRQQDSHDRPTLEELWQQSAALSEQIAQHLSRGVEQ